jgi:hypothetical protein
MKVFKKAEKFLGEGYRKIYCLMDMDTIYSEKKLESYLTYKKKLEKKGIVILESNPYFEIWILLHYLRTTRAFGTCEDVSDFIKKNTEIKDYNKTQEYHARQNFYKKLKHLLEKDAVPNAQFLEHNKEGQRFEYPRSEVFKLFYALGILKEES